MEWKFCNNHIFAIDQNSSSRLNCIECGLVKDNENEYTYPGDHKITSTVRGNVIRYNSNNFGDNEKYPELYQNFCKFIKRKKIYSTNLEVFDRFLKNIIENEEK